MAIDTTYTHARAHLASLCDSVVHDRDTVIIRRRGAEDVALLSAAELWSLEETVHLLRSPKNAARLLAALNRATTSKLRPPSPNSRNKKLRLAPTRPKRSR